MNAIILAAGLGSRFNNLTKENHKALLPINDIPNIERTIQYLHEFGIQEIHIVTGHMAHLFDYLVARYDCNLIYNPNYANYNSIYSFYLASDFFKNSLVIDADVVLLDNIFTSLEQSTYYVIKRPKSEDAEWIPVLSKQNLIKDIQVSNANKPSLLGISYWDEVSCEIIKKEIPKFLNKENLENSKLYWDNIPIMLLDKIKVGMHLVGKNQAAEMDTIENYHYICDTMIKACYTSS
ncbi:CTP--phosphocholine cytidylyltransferase [Photorhabdus luminescens]|uniref:CTP--phosphocholine cytidylyltransferase n=1 Tax=Photorhabdus akhurstii TaxID=171438 RepID=A0ABX8M3R6_9GAMM|nr:NTP transferase domain-containing protein [Photorhabdus akhurstii]QXF36033.1 CTP--phosphocholine cytidylyltransferase [Photorhabdus akhurstii]UJD77873.1 CTP--phosphocholine cytidylyltransferase [Photorhabdus luminescens]